MSKQKSIDKDNLQLRTMLLKVSINSTQNITTGAAVLSGHDWLKWPVPTFNTRNMLTMHANKI